MRFYRHHGYDCSATQDIVCQYASNTLKIRFKEINRFRKIHGLNTEKENSWNIFFIRLTPLEAS